MKYRFTLSIVLLFFITCGSFTSFAQEQEYYQLKTYTIKNDTQENMVDHYLKNAYLPALKRMGIKNIGVFKVIPGKFTISNKIYVLIPFQSLAEFNKLEAMLAVDKTHFPG